MQISTRGALAALKALATLNRLKLPLSTVERRRRGFILLQIDALSHIDVQRAIEAGHMPHLRKMLGTTHRLSRWRCGVPSDTAAIQCSFMYGNRSNIPGFYWFDKRKRAPVICSWPMDMAAVEAENAAGRAGLFRHGSVYTGMASGGAQRAVFTTSALGKTRFPPKLTGLDVFLLLALNPWRLGRAVVLTAAEILIELVEQAMARFRRRYVAPEGIFPLTRAFTHVFFREMATLGIRLDIFRGVPAIYANYIGYDEVGHHLGPTGGPAYRTLKALDRQVRDIERTINYASTRHYDLYVMSDHGMTESLPFHHLYGETLAQFIAGHGVRPAKAAELDTRPLRDEATLKQMQEFSADIGPRTRGLTQFLVDRAMRTAMRIGTGPLQAGLADQSDAPLLAIYSSALANVYFVDVPHRMERTEIEERSPGLLRALVEHPGVGIVLVTEGNSTLIVTDNSVIDLENCADEDIQFLSLYDSPPLVKEQLMLLSRMRCAGDILVFGAYDGHMVVNFEDHCGAHGGLGGRQMFPFMMSPADVADAFDNVTDAVQLHPFFAGRYQFPGRSITSSPSHGAINAPLAAGE